jgi:DNA-binding NtrC family response regulator
MRKEKILIVDDSAFERKSIETMLNARDFDALSAGSSPEALAILGRDSFDVVITDMRLPGMDGISLTREIKKSYPGVGVIMITGYGTIESAVQALREGAYDYITKPMDENRLIITIRNLIEHSRIEKENVNLRRSLQEKYRFENIIGSGGKMQEVYDTMSLILNTKTTIMIRGESGTGKELIAEAIHYNSNRKDKSLIKVHCAALAETLLESELFGHEKGAFTTAIKQKEGRFELANNGTLFLDEIGELSQNVQVKLLRVLQEEEFERVGGTQTIKIDVRIVAATSRNLEEEIKKGNFREDLYYRLHVVPIYLPPLRERKEDIGALIEHFIGKYNKENNRNISGVTEEALGVMLSYDWPGNVRELENAIEHGVALTKGPHIGPYDLPLQIRSLKKGTRVTVPVGSNKTLKEMEKELILAALNSNNWNRVVTARQLGIDRTTLYQKIKKYSLQENTLRESR